MVEESDRYGPTISEVAVRGTRDQISGEHRVLDFLLGIQRFWGKSSQSERFVHVFELFVVRPEDVQQLSGVGRRLADVPQLDSFLAPPSDFFQLTHLLSGHAFESQLGLFQVVLDQFIGERCFLDIESGTEDLLVVDSLSVERRAKRTDIFCRLEGGTPPLERVESRKNLSPGSVNESRFANKMRM